MARLSPLMVAPLVVFAAFAGLAFIGLYRENPDALPSALAGQQAPAVETTPLGNKPGFGDADLRAGEVSLVNYWASWCAPCRVEHPNLVKLAEAGVPIYGINFKDDPAKAADFLAELGNPYTAIGADLEGRSGFAWGAYGVPETYLIDGEGRILARVAGPVTTSTFGRDLGPALEAAGIEVDLSD